MKILFRFDVSGCTLTLRSHDDGSWEVHKVTGAGSGYSVLATTVFEYAREAFNKEIERCELTVKEAQ